MLLPVGGKPELAEGRLDDHECGVTVTAADFDLLPVEVNLHGKEIVEGNGTVGCDSCHEVYAGSVALLAPLSWQTELAGALVNVEAKGGLIIDRHIEGVTPVDYGNRCHILDSFIYLKPPECGVRAMLRQVSA